MTEKNQFQYKNILLDHGLNIFASKFVEELFETSLNEDERRRLEFTGRAILWSNRNCGFGYISSSVSHDRGRELRVTKHIVDCFRRRENPVQPVVIPIDYFYRLFPSNPSLVMKVQTFDKVITRQHPAEESAIILSGFTESEIFTQSTLKQVPCQRSAGLDIFEPTQFGKDLLEFAYGRLSSLIEKCNGDLRIVLKIILEAGDFLEEDARLLLVTGLLLQDAQRWQSLWYEGRERGTPLYIVAPMSFHDAMNRLNFGWGHGNLDYRYRASNSLGNHDEPPLEDNVFTEDYDKQGLSPDEFQRRVGPIIDKFKE